MILAVMNCFVVDVLCWEFLLQFCSCNRRHRLYRFLCRGRVKNQGRSNASALQAAAAKARETKAAAAAAAAAPSSRTYQTFGGEAGGGGLQPGVTVAVLSGMYVRPLLWQLLTQQQR